MASRKQVENGRVTVDEAYFRHMLSLLAVNWRQKEMLPDANAETLENVRDLTEIALRQGRAILDERRISHENKVDDRREIKYEDFL